MLFLFGINLKKQTKKFKTRTQERKVATYTSTNLKSRFFSTMAHGITCTQLLGKKPKMEMAKMAYQDGHIKMKMIKKGQEGHDTQTCSFM